MALSLDYPPGATPLDPDEAQGLVPKHILNHGQLNEWEFQNVLKGERWAFGRKQKLMLEIQFIRQLHKRMFGDTWRWAGTFRVTEKNIGVDPICIQPTLQDLCKDVETQLLHRSYRLDEIAARFSHRMVFIHPFANGNGRFSRTIADLLLVQNGAERFTWGAADLGAESDARKAYLQALRAADAKDYGPLLAFVRA